MHFNRWLPVALALTLCGCGSIGSIGVPPNQGQTVPSQPVAGGLPPAGTYPGQDEAVMTIAQPNFLAVRDDVPEEHVYLFTKTVYENLPFLQAIHPATKAMAIEKAIAGLPMPLHPGAARYYKEVGIDIPDRLMAP